MVGGSSAGIRTERSGSILSPASQNSLVGLKPTVSLIRRSRIIHISHTEDTLILLNLLQGHDEKDPITGTNPNIEIDYTKYLSSKGLKGK